jgi:hypothetical protein
MLFAPVRLKKTGSPGGLGLPVKEPSPPMPRPALRHGAPDGHRPEDRSQASTAFGCTSKIEYRGRAARSPAPCRPPADPRAVSLIASTFRCGRRLRPARESPPMRAPKRPRREPHGPAQPKQRGQGRKKRRLFRVSGAARSPRSRRHADAECASTGPASPPCSGPMRPSRSASTGQLSRMSSR